MVQQLVQARSRIDFGLNKADEVALNFETIFRGKGNYFERMENLGKILFMTHIIIQYESYYYSITICVINEIFPKFSIRSK